MILYYITYGSIQDFVTFSECCKIIKWDEDVKTDNYVS